MLDTANTMVDKAEIMSINKKHKDQNQKRLINYSDVYWVRFGELFETMEEIVGISTLLQEIIKINTWKENESWNPRFFHIAPST